MNSNENNNNNIFKLSRQQRALLAHGEAFAGQQRLIASIRIRGELDVSRLESAIVSLLHHHEILRTQFIQVEGFLELCQVISDSVEFQGVAEHIDNAELLSFQLFQSDAQTSKLVVSASRALVDSLTMNKLFSELAELYLNGEVQCEEPLQYVDFSDWQDEFVEEDKDGLAFWQERTNKVETRQSEYSIAKNDADCARQTLPQGASINEILTSLLIAKYKLSAVFNQSVCIQQSGRLTEDFMAGFGPYALTLPLAIQPDEQSSFGLLLDKVTSELELLALNQLSAPETQIESLSARLSVELLEKPVQVKGDEVSFEFASLARTVSANSLHLMVVEQAQQSELVCYFGASIEAAQVQALLTGLVTVLNHKKQSNFITDMTLCPEQAVSAISVGETFPTSTQPFLHQAVQQRAAESPDQIALSDVQGTMTYQQLQLAVNDTVNQLVECGVKAGDRVAIALPRQRALLVSILAVLRVGAAYVPIDPQTPAQRALSILEHCQLLIETEVTWPELNAQVPTQLSLVIGEAQSTIVADVEVAADSVAYVLFTSGSTGKPKGVEVSHSNLRHYLTWSKNKYLEDVDYAIVATAISFDLTVTGLLGPLYSGKEVYLVDGDDALNGIKKSLQARTDKALLKLTPSHLKALNPWFSEQKALNLGCVILGGEELHNSDLKPLSAFSEVRIFNEYGPTEATVGCCVAECYYDSEHVGGLSIGSAIDNTELLILDEQGRQVAPFQIGELYICGHGVALGYLAMPELTEKSFVQLELAGGKKTVAYRTGDFAYHNGSGELNFFGRIDEQIKIRGYRIELTEIESHIQALDEVESVCVLAKDIADDAKQLVAFVVGKALQQEHAQAQIQSAIAPHLPEYMVPSLVAVLDTMPLTNNGKIDKKHLQQIDTDAIKRAPYVAPTTSLQQQLCQAWESVLCCERVGINDNYFSLGGDSIFSLQIVAQLKSNGVQIDVQDIFTYQTVASLSEYLESSDNSVQEVTELAPFALVNEQEKQALNTLYQDAYPMSSLQLGMVFHSQADDHKGVYHDIFTNHVKYQWQEAAFRSAVSAMVDKHPILRTGFLLDRDVPLQVVHKHSAVPLKVFDVSALSVNEQDEKLQEWIELTLTREFDWVQGPLFEVVVFLRGQDSFEFCLSFHHSLLDGWSRAALTTDLYENYQLLLAGQALPQVEANWLFRDFISLEQNALNSEAAHTFFSEMLDEVPLNQLPTQSSVKSGEIALFEKNTFIDHSQSLLKLAQQVGVSVKSLLLAIHFKVISELSGNQAALSCVSNHGRPEVANADKGLGLFLNLLPLKLELSQGSWKDYILQVHELLMNSQRHRHFPLSNVQKLTGQDYSEVTFNYTHFHIYSDILDDSSSELELLNATGFEQTNFNFQTEFSRAHDTDSITMVIKYDTGLFNADFIARVADYYESVVVRLLTDINANHFAQSLISPDETALLAHWQHGKHLPSCGKDVVALIVEQAQKNPDAIAIADAQVTLNYQQLLEKSIRLAAYLQEMEIGHGNYVGIYVERSPEMLVSILGVLMSGAAYVPIDPRNTGERLQHILHDTGMELILLHSSSLERVPLAGLDTLLIDDCLESDWFEDYADADETLPSIDLSDTAYVIYTSGSTGLPKGVEIAHAGLLDYCEFALSDYYQGVANGSIVVTSHGFDITIPSLYLPLLTGQQVYLLPWGEEVGQLQTALVTNPAALVRMTPTHVKGYLTTLSDEFISDATPTFVIGGEALELEVLLQLRKHYPNAHYFNHYGPTEAVVGCCIYRVDFDAPVHSGVTPIGRPMANTQVYVVDAQNNLSPIGATGELLVSGVCVAKGYLNLPEQTAASFIDNHFTHSSYKMYRTGDRVRWNKEGLIEYVGRTDGLVKYNGYRIELGEIETALSTMQGINQAAVKVFDNGQSQRLIAYLVAPELAQNESAANAQIKQMLQGMVAEYMQPQQYVFVDTLPTSLNGKLDRKALLEPDVQAFETAQYQAPETAIEAQLCQILQSVLPVEKVGRSDNFFHLGGDSIVAIQVASKAKREGLVVTVKQLFATPIVSDLAHAVESMVMESIDQSDCVGSQALLPVQQRFFARQFDNKHHYNQALLLSTPAEFNAQSLVEILRALFKRHDGLRLSFVLHDGQWQGKYNPVSETLLQQATLSYDLTTISPELQQAEMEKIAQQLQSAFVLDQAPLFKAIYFRYSDSDGRLLLLAHHLVVDGVSWRIIAADLESAYQRVSQGLSIELAAKTASLQAWSNKLEDLAQQPEIQSQLPYWKDSLSSQFKAPAGQTAVADDMQSVHFELSEENTTQLLGDANKAFRTQINELLLAALVRAYSNTYDSENVCVELESHGREAFAGLPDVTDTVGWFTSIYPLVLRTSSDVDLEALVAKTKRTYRDVPMNGFGYSLLCTYGKDADFQTLTTQLNEHALLFNYLGQLDNTAEQHAGFKMVSEPVGTLEGDPLARKNLNIVAMVQAGKLSVRVSYLGQLTPLQQFADNYKAALEQVLQLCSQVNDETALFESAESLFATDNVDLEEGIEI
ncbi:amino acid adenylation domain-containing protein [Pseudoalteromonas sp. T1lg65]|uniref:amino acid adenylation domain-containing protein n=1 Tax=Pseudoalteromonas sp. T1lg65 TaxID=2077101 RepID=UPI003F7A46D7